MAAHTLKVTVTADLVDTPTVTLGSLSVPMALKADGVYEGKRNWDFDPSVKLHFAGKALVGTEWTLSVVMDGKPEPIHSANGTLTGGGGQIEYDGVIKLSDS